MKCLTHEECVVWARAHGYPLVERDPYGYPLPDYSALKHHVINLKNPDDSGAKMYVANSAISLFQDSPEQLLWLRDWAVFPSSSHMPLFTRFRQAHGEARPLIEAPSQVCRAEEREDAVSILAVALFFIWDCHVMSGTGTDVFVTSHDEYSWFATASADKARQAHDLLERFIVSE